jgi:glutamine amidotransferase
MKKICVIDYDSGNIKSVYNALRMVLVGSKNSIVVSSEKEKIKEASHIILPGVGSFNTCIEGLKKKKVLNILEEKVFKSCQPFLGICVGMQMLSTKGFENGSHSGLNWIPGKVTKISRINESMKIPHMGWNKLIVKRRSKFIKNLGEKVDLKKNFSAYFVHSYELILEDKKNLVLSTEYGTEITAMVKKENIIGTQFHPEKSHLFGLKFLETFIEIS